MSRGFKIDEGLLAEAKRLGQHRTAQETVAAVLNEYVVRRRQLKILELFGTIDYEAAYDYKQAGNEGAPKIVQVAGETERCLRVAADSALAIFGSSRHTVRRA